MSLKDREFVFRLCRKNKKRSASIHSACFLFFFPACFLFSLFLNSFSSVFCFLRFFVFLRLAYKIHGPTFHLNSDPGAEQRAEWDRRSLAEVIAEVHVEKAKALWMEMESKWTENKTSSRYMGVSYNKRSRKYSVSRSHQGYERYRELPSEEEAAAWYDRAVVAAQGASAMTNAKYYGGPGVRELAWKEWEAELARRLQRGMDCTSEGFHP